ncbi:MAG: CehA/McbA family metallohydrolase [Planctomycetota bacterium]
MTTALALFVTGLALAATPEPVDVITNGGFEEGFSSWTPDAKHEIVRGSEEAHSGQACVTGEVTAPKQALFLKQKIRVRRDCRYDFECFARATNGTKLVLFVVQPGTTQRKSVAAWDGLKPRWQKCATAVDVQADGTLELQLIAPSSHSSPVGRIWVDDVKLLEAPRPMMASVSAGKGYNDEPAMASADDGSIYVAWNSFRDGADSLQLTRYELAGKAPKLAGSWQVLGGKGTYLLGLHAVAAGPQVYLLYAAEVDKNWDIYAVACGRNGPGTPIRITRGPEVDIKPFGVWRDGKLWVTWESALDSWRQVSVGCLENGRLSGLTRLTDAGVSNYAPTLAVLPGGHVAVAWHSFRENNFDLYFRELSPGGAWQAERRLTKAPTIDRHALLLPRGNELWLVYENALMGPPEIDAGPDTRTYGIGATRTRRLILAKVSSEGLQAPSDYQQAPIFKSKAEAATAAFDQAGRLWLACRVPGELTGAGAKAKPRDWRVAVTCYDGRGWSEPAIVSAMKGMDRPSPIVLSGSRAVICHQADDTPGRWQTEEEAIATGQSGIYLATVDVGPAASAQAMNVVPLVEPQEPFAPGVIRQARGEDMPTPSITYNGQKLNLYFGDLHDHTDISICNRNGDESVDESYANMRDIARHDFACATDHGYNINPYLWNYLAKLARVNEDPSRFLTFLGEEWTSSIEEYSVEHPFGFYGHRNLIFADTYFPRWWNAFNRQTPADVWEDLRKMNANFVHIPHQLADTGNVPTDWNFADETAQPVAEIFQGRGSYEYKGTPREAARTTPETGYFLQDAWARGIVIGVIASPDHTGGYGKACVYAPELSREAILDAIRARRCYGTTAAKIVLDVRVDGHLMGEKLSAPAGQSVSVAIRAQCPAEIDRVEVCRNNQFIYLQRPGGRDCELTFVDRKPLPGRSYYYVRVIQKDEEIAWSSPVWFGAE